MDPNWIAGIDTFIFDCDGVLWRGSHLIPGAKKTLAYLRVLGKKILFVTNNATKSRRAYLQKFKELDLEAHLVIPCPLVHMTMFSYFIRQNEVFGSAYAAAYYMKHALQFPADKKVYVIGMEGMTEELDEQGISYVGAMVNYLSLFGQ